MAYEALQLELAKETELGILMSWFHDLQSCRDWGGPDFRFPFSKQSFQADLRWELYRGYVLKGRSNTLLGFGQFYQRNGRCHLARLVIAPDKRGQGLGKVLVKALMAEGCKQLQLSGCSLFVLKHNAAAKACYQGLGFQPAEYPEPIPELAGCDYLICN
ncbi:GNAT family N-acetyltransferase [Alkalimonas sp. NCh-2]|uniref:GNAT family N-acetyltransferase n=1 Tax=Alkalimonas sp. NCh-2 TaxID=3144846 RepID=UPI0031F63C36